MRRRTTEDERCVFELTWKYKQTNKQTAVCKKSKVPLYFIIVMIGFVFVYSNFKICIQRFGGIGIYIFGLVLTGSK